MSKAAEGRFYIHYKGGLYFITNIGYDVDRECDMITYVHVSGKKYYRSLAGFEQPVNNPRYNGPRFTMVPADFRFTVQGVNFITYTTSELLK